MSRGVYDRSKLKTKTKKKYRQKKVILDKEFIKHTLQELQYATGGVSHLGNAKVGEFTGECIIPHGIESTLAARGAQYGDFTTQAVIVQEFKEVLYNMPHWSKFKPFMKEGIEMILHKVGRAGNGNPFNPDTWNDIAGYAKLIADRINGLKINQKDSV